MNDWLDLDTRLIAVPEVPKEFSTKVRFARMWKREPSGIILNQRGAFRQLFQAHLATIFLGVGQVSLWQRFWYGGTHHDLLVRGDFIKVLTREKNLHPPWHVVLVLLPIL